MRSASSGTTSQAMSRMAFSESTWTTLRAMRSMSSSLRPAAVLGAGGATAIPAAGGYMGPVAGDAS